MLSPLLRLARHAYRRPPFTDDSRRRFEETLHALMVMVRANEPGGAWCADDMLAWFRSQSFLSDPIFAHAVKPYIGHAALRARLWRIYTLCWAAASCARLDGIFLDCGCYNGYVTDIVYRYCGAAADTHAWYLYDVFDPVRSIIRKKAHGPTLATDVMRLFRDRPNVTVTPGLLPQSLHAPNRTAFMSLDLNDGLTEIDVLVRVFDSVVDGGMIVLDDYGDTDYFATQQNQQTFFAQRGHHIYESPTGQGIVIKRSCARS